MLKLSLLGFLYMACGFQGTPFLDGNRPIVLDTAQVPMFAPYAREAAQAWNPQAKGAPQTVRLRWDTSQRCAENLRLAGFSSLLPPTINVCPTYAPDALSARWFLLHELGHLLSGPHVVGQNAIMHDPPTTPPPQTYTPIDIAAICAYGTGGRCGN